MNSHGQVRDNSRACRTGAQKRDAEAVLKKIGLTSSEAITLFLTQVKLNEGLPFPVRIPNRQTRQAIKDAREGKNVEEFEFDSRSGQRRCAHCDPSCGASVSNKRFRE